MSDVIERIISTLESLSARVRHLEVVESGLLPHASRHQDGGSDEINVTGLSGKLADPQDAGWLRGRTVSSTAPSDGQALIWNASSSAWTPTTLPTVAGKTIVSYGRVNSSSSITLSNSWQDVPGCSQTLTIQSGDVVIIIGCFDFTFQYTSSSNVLYGGLSVGGTTRGVRANFCGYNPGVRVMATQVWVETPSAGSVEFKLQAMRSASGTGDTCNATHTTMTWVQLR
jgi:hypothetical protein